MKLVHEAGHREFALLRNYYGRIIRDADEFARIRQYSIDNPAGGHTGKRILRAIT